VRQAFSVSSWYNAFNSNSASCRSKASLVVLAANTDAASALQSVSAAALRLSSVATDAFTSCTANGTIRVFYILFVPFLIVKRSEELPTRLMLAPE